MNAEQTRHVSQTYIDAPVETVWSILTKTDEPLPFFFGAICQAKPELAQGNNMRMIHRNGKIVMVVGEVLEFDPPHRYSHTFKMTHLADDVAKVTYALSPKGNGTDFELIIEDAVPGSKLEKDMISAQSFIGGNLKSLAETGKPAFSGKMVGLLAPIFGLLAKKSQAENLWKL